MRRTLLLRICLLAVLSWPTAAFAAAESLRWQDLPALPVPGGVGGPVVGVHEGVLIVAGGANFPGDPPWSVDGRPPGTKVRYDRIFALLPGASGWIEAGRLPRPLAYAATVSTAEGVFVLGGEVEEGGVRPSADVLLLRWNPADRTVSVRERALPPLPKPSTYHAAALLDGAIYVAAAHAKSDASETLDEKSFWSCDLTRPAGERVWIDREPWPGPPRSKSAVAVQHAGADDRYATPECLYLFGGQTWFKDADGRLDPARFRDFTDAYRYEPRSGTWTAVADLPPVPAAGDPRAAAPRPATAATAIAVGQSHVLLFSGATDRYLMLDLARQPPFPRDVLAYHTITDTWTVLGEMPVGVVTTTAANWDGRIVIPSGEVRPGVRTDRVQSLRIEPRAFGFGGLNLAVVGGYLALLVAVGFYFSRREQGTDDFFLGGRRIPWWAAGVSIYATQLSAITFVSLPAIPYATNWVVYPSQWMITLFAPVVVFFYLPFFRRLNVTSAYEYLGKRFDDVVRQFGSLSFVVFQFGRMAIVVYLPALALAAVTGLNVYLCILVMGVLATLYTVLGGMEAVIWTDVVQVGVLWGGMALAIVFIVRDRGDVGAVYNAALNDGKLTLWNWSWDTGQMATWLVLVGFFALQFFPYTADQAVVQRYMTTKDAAAAARSVWFNGLLVVPSCFVFFVLGTCLYVFFKAHPALLSVGMENDRIFPLFMAEQLPPGVSGLVVAGVFAASMSSLDSSMHSVATAVVIDFYAYYRPETGDRRRLRVARAVTLFTGAAGTAGALVLAGFDIRSLFFFFQKLLGLLGSGLVGIFILGIFTTRANAAGALAGAIAGFAALCYVVFWTQLNFYLYAVVGIGTSVVAGYLVSLMTPPPAQDLAGLTWRTRATPARATS